MARRPIEFDNFPSRIHPGFGPYPAIARPDIRYDDGDTVWFFIDKGFHDYEFQPIRLWGVDAPELRRRESAEAGRAARDYLFALIPGGTPVQLWTEREKDRHGRYVAAIFSLAPDGELRCVNVDMVTAGHAVPVEMYGWLDLLAICVTLGVEVPDDF